MFALKLLKSIINTETQKLNAPTYYKTLKYVKLTDCPSDHEVKLQQIINNMQQINHLFFHHNFIEPAVFKSNNKG